MTAKISTVLLFAAMAPVFALRSGIAQNDSNVILPRPIYAPDPEYSEQARKAGFQGTDFPVSSTIQPCPETTSPMDQQTTPAAAVTSVVELTLEGATQVPIEEQDRIAASIKSREFTDSPENAKVKAVELVREAWQDRGFLKAQVSGESRVLTSSAILSRISVSTQIDEGEQYRLAGITFQGSKAISDVPTLRDLFPMKDGEIFSRKQFAQGLENLLKAYKVQGYANFISVPDPDFDEAERTVRFAIDMDEGKQFFVSAINLIAEDENAFEKASQDLLLKVGQLYNQNLLDLFAEKHPFAMGHSSLSGFRLNDRQGTVAISLDLRQCHAQ